MTRELTYLAKESMILLYSGALGIEVALVYDLLRALRRTFRCNQFVIAFMDLFFWGFTGFRSFYIMHTYSNGTLRWFAIFGTLFVVTIYMLIASRFVLAIEIYLLTRVRKVLLAIKKCLTKFLKLSIIKGVAKQQRKER